MKILKRIIKKMEIKNAHKHPNHNIDLKKTKMVKLKLQKVKKARKLVKKLKRQKKKHQRSIPSDLDTASIRSDSPGVQPLTPLHL